LNLIIQFVTDRKDFDLFLIPYGIFNDDQLDFFKTLLMIKYDFLNYIKKQKLINTVDYCSIASCYARLDILVCLHEHGCPWDYNSCIYAAEKGNLECLKYLHENGCPL